MRNLVLMLALTLLPMSVVMAQEATPAPVQTTEQKEGQRWMEIITANEIHAVSIFSLGDGLSFCSGAVIETNDKYSKVLTAKHCINVTEEMYVEQVLVKKVETSTEDDLALLTTAPIPNKTAVALATDNEPLYKMVFTLGYPDGENLYIGFGYTLRNTKDWQWARMKVKHGCSGGGVYNEQGLLVGILWGGLNMEETDGKKGMAILEPIKDVRKFLNQIDYKVAE